MGWVRKSGAGAPNKSLPDPNPLTISIATLNGTDDNDESACNDDDNNSDSDWSGIM